MNVAIWAYLAWTVFSWLLTVCYDPAKKTEPTFSPNTTKAIRIIFKTLFVCFAVGLVVTR